MAPSSQMYMPPEKAGRFKGVYLRLRSKFGENLWRSDSKSVNRSLPR
jgi:hypothetical protein